MGNVLLVGGGVQVLAVSRSLHEIGCTVSLLIEDDLVAAHGKFVDNVYLMSLSEEHFLGALFDVLDNHVQDVIIPMSDTCACFLSKNKNNIETKFGVKCAIPDFNVFSKVYDKWNLMEECNRFNISHPKTFLLNADSLQEAANYLGFPSLVKPNISVGAKGIKLVNNFIELKNHYEVITRDFGECSLQELIIAPDQSYYNAMLYRKRDGSFCNYVILKIIRYYPIEGGSSSCCVTVNNEKILTMCMNLLEKINWIGFADLDIIEDDKSDYKVLEINPRVPASVRAASISGINFPAIIYSDLMQKDVFCYIYKPGKILRYLGLDIMWFFKSPRRFECKPSWFKFWGHDIYYQEGGWKEFRAIIFNFYLGIKKQLSKKFRESKSYK